MAINQNIQQFYRAAESRDFSRDFLFRVEAMNLPGLRVFADTDLVYVKAAQLPGRNITNVPVPYMGLNINVPGGVTYPGSDSYALNFYLDAKSQLRKDFEAASRNMFNDNDSTGLYGTTNRNFYIQLTQLDKKLDPINNGTYRLVGASIRNVNSIDYQIATGTGNTVEIGVTVAYHYYETENFKARAS